MVIQRQVNRERKASVRSGFCARLPLRGFGLALLAAVMVILVSSAPSSLRSEQNLTPPKAGEVVPNAAANEPAASTSPEKKAEPKKSNLQKTQDDAAALSALADQLRDELNKLNANVLALDVIHKTEEVEKLARKIRGEANKP